MKNSILFVGVNKLQVAGCNVTRPNLYELDATANESNWYAR